MQVLQTERLIYLVTEYASGGEIFGKLTSYLVLLVLTLCYLTFGTGRYSVDFAVPNYIIIILLLL